jgi:glycosyltransferase involved in cell wall biosynthesis
MQIQRRLIWASRLDEQKRPYLLLKIAEETKRCVPDIGIDIWGSAVLRVFDVSQFERYPNLKYCGPFEKFIAVRPDRYDLFIYTSAHDGLPNVVLEAMAAGLGVIAADVGGVSEAVVPGAGILIDCSRTDDDVARAYVDAILHCYEDPDRISKMREGAQAVIAKRHRKALFDAEVKRLFQCDGQVVQPDVDAVIVSLASR